MGGVGGRKRKGENEVIILSFQRIERYNEFYFNTLNLSQDVNSYVFLRSNMQRSGVVFTWCLEIMLFLNYYNTKTKAMAQCSKYSECFHCTDTTFPFITIPSPVL